MQYLPKLHVPQAAASACCVGPPDVVAAVEMVDGEKVDDVAAVPANGVCVCS